MKVLLTAGLAAASMYFFDPSRGADRRAGARARLEEGKDVVARAVHDAGNGLDAKARDARAAGRNLRDEAGVSHSALGSEARHLAAGAAAAFASLLNRKPSRRLAGLKRGRSTARLIPGGFVTLAGLGAAALYYFGGPEGETRRAHLRDRLSGWRHDAQAKVRAARQKLPGEDARSTWDEDISASANGTGGQLGEEERLRDRPLQG